MLCRRLSEQIEVYVSGKGGRTPLLPPGFSGAAELGIGGASEVWAVTYEATGERFALKIATKPDPAHRLEREFAILRRLDHPGIVKVVECGKYEGREYFTMELIKGKPFTSFMAERRKDKDFTAIFLNAMRKTASILSDLHKQGIIHIDLKPSNLLIKDDGEPVLLDFGFAEDYLLSPTAEPSGTTLDYAAPELFSLGYVTPAADIYSLGAVGYEVLSGRKLWEGKSFPELIKAKLKPPRGLGKLDIVVPSGLEELILRMLNPEPALRPSADTFLAEIMWLTRGEKVASGRELGRVIPKLCFGGRDEETAKLEELVFVLKRVVIMEGELGIGKSRLLNELRFRALLRGSKVLFVEARGAYLSLVDYLEALLGLAAAEQVIHKLQRFERIYQSIHKSGFDAIMIDVPLDFSKDEEEFMGYLARGLDQKLGLVLAGVAYEVYPEAERLQLKPLDEKKILPLVSRTFEGLEEETGLANVLVSVGNGIPGRMNELLNLLYHEGWIHWEDGWKYSPAKDEKALAKRLDTWLGAAVGGLDKTSSLVLSLLALSESALPGEVLASIVGESATPFILQGLENRRFVRSRLYLERPHYYLENELISSYLLGKLPSGKEESLSEKLALAMEDFCVRYWGADAAKWDISYLVQVASLYSKAGIKTKAPRYLIAAGRRLMKALVHKKGKELLQKALTYDPNLEEKKDALSMLGDIAYAEHNPDQAHEYYSQVLPLVADDAEKSAEVLSGIAHAYTLVGNFQKAEDFLKQAEERLPDSSPHIRCKILYDRSFIAYYTNRLEESQAFAEQSLEHATTDNERARALQSIAGVFLSQGDAYKSLEYYKKSLELALESGIKHNSCHILLNMERMANRIGMKKEAEEYLDQALAIADEIHYPVVTADALCIKASFLASQGRYREARDVARQGLAVAKKINEIFRITGLRCDEASYSSDIGDWEHADTTYRQIWKEFVRLKHPLAKTTLVSVLERWAPIYKLKGNFIAARRMYGKAKSLAESTRDPHTAQGLESELIRVDIASGEFKKARAALERFKQQGMQAVDSNSTLWLALLEAEILLGEGDAEQAQKVASGLVANVEKIGGYKILVDVLLVLGKTLVASSRFEEGVSRLTDSLDVAKKQEQPYEQALALYEIAASILEKDGYNEEALSKLEDAQIIYERLGALPQLEKIKKLHEKYFDVKGGKAGFSNQYLESLKQVSELIHDLRTKATHLAEKEKEAGLPIQYLQGLREISELINFRLGKENFMGDILDIVLKLTTAQRGMIFMIEDGELYPVSSKRMDNATSNDAKLMSQTIVRKIQEGLEPVYTSDAAIDERFNRSQSIMLNDIRSLMCIPLKTDEKLIGTIYVDSHQAGLFDAEKTVYFEALGNLLAATIDKSLEFKKLREDMTFMRKRDTFEKSGTVIGKSRTIKKLCSQLEQVAKSDSNILLEGETGTGKGVFARLIHESSSRGEREFFSINCGVLPEGVLDSELFGCRKGAFTSATENRVGLLEAADGSTAFFDEITNTSLSVQAKLLEVIEERVIRRLGETKPRRVNLRFIFATNRDLKEEVKAGRFREDLYFRINALTLTLPPLRERKEDIAEFIEFFMRKFSTEFNKDITGMEDSVRQALLDYSWPGNIRELKNVIERSVLLSSNGRITRDLLEQHFFPISSKNRKVGKSGTDGMGAIKKEDLNLERAKQHLERDLIREALTRYKTVDEAAEALGISARSLWRKKKLLDI